MKKLLSFDEFVNESKVNEGAVKQFEIAMKNLINNIRAGYGWIDPEYVYDTVVTDGEFDEFNWNDIKDEVYQRLIDQNLLYYANDADPEVKGQKVSNIKSIKESVNEGTFYRLPRKTIENDLWQVAKDVQNFFSRASAGVDCKPEELDSIIKNLEKIKKQVKKFSGREEVSGTVYESDFFEINEGDVNYTSDKYALVFVGGSIGSFNLVPVFTKGRIGSVIETSNDLEDLKATAARRRKQLSPGERKYYGMSYTVIELTPNKIKQIDNLIAQQSSNNDKIVDESEINEGVEDAVKKEVISKLSDFFRCSPSSLSKFKFDGNDNIKELTKALRSTSDEGTAQYYRVAIQMAKRDLGLNEAADEFVVATLSEDFEDLKKGQTVKIKAIEFTQGGDKETIESIRPDGKKMEIKKAIIEVKI